MKVRAPKTVPMPRTAREHVTVRYETGEKRTSEYRVGRDVVAIMHWETDGRPIGGWSLRAGKQHGRAIEWHDNGEVAYVEPYVAGSRHGIAQHFDAAGKLLLESRYVRGTGVDLWCDLTHRTLAEEHRLEAGHRVEYRDWNADERTVHREELSDLVDGRWCSIVRAWNAAGKLRRGFPEYLIDWERVAKRVYVRQVPATSRAAFRASDDRNTRALPAEYIGQPVHREHARGRRSHAR